MRRAIAILVTMLLATVVGVPAQAAEPNGDQHLLEAFGFVGAKPSAFSFIDWASVRRAHGLSELSSARPIRDLRAAKDLFQKDGLSREAMIGLGDDAATWGWDQLDVDWQAGISLDAGGTGISVAVTRVLEGVSVDDIASRWEGLGYHLVPGTKIPTWRLEPDDWPADVRFTGFHATWAIWDDHTIIGGPLEGLDHYLELRDQKLGDQDFGAMSIALLQLGAPLVARIDVFNCGYVDPSVADLNAELLADVGPLHPWYAIAAATYREPSGPASGRIVFVYPSFGSASDDQPDRERLRREAKDGAGNDFSALYFDLQASHAGWLDLVMDVTPAHDDAARVMTPYPDRLPFAGCG